MASARAHATPRHAEALRPLADKIMCDHCCNKYPLGPYYFPDYKPYVTETEVERVRMESRADYNNPARQAAECFKKYCVHECEEFAAEHAAPDVNDPKTNEALDKPLPADVAPAHDVTMCVLTSVVDAVCSDFKVRHVYAEQHKDALAAVGPVLDDILCDAEHVGQVDVCRRPSRHVHWDLSVSARVPVKHRDAQGWYVREGILYLRAQLKLFKIPDCASSATWGA